MDNESGQSKEQKNETPLNELLTSSLVDIYVGSESTHWTLHERLLCHNSPFFASIFEGDDETSEKKSKKDKSYTLRDEDSAVFQRLVGWLYSRSISHPKSEDDIGPLLELYLLAQKLKMSKLGLEIVEAVRDWYHSSGTYPGLRRVQYIYSETDEDNEMREMMVSSVARQLTTSDKIPAYWSKALQRNGQLAVDIIRSIQQWNIEAKTIPDARDGSRSRGRSSTGLGFSAITREGGESVETTGTTDTNLGVESLNSATSVASDTPNAHDASEEKTPIPTPKENPPPKLPIKQKEEEKEERRQPPPKLPPKQKKEKQRHPPPKLSSKQREKPAPSAAKTRPPKLAPKQEDDDRPPPTPPRPTQKRNKPPDEKVNEMENANAKENQDTKENENQPIKGINKSGKDEEKGEEKNNTETGKMTLKSTANSLRSSLASRPESIFLLMAWLVYFIYNISAL